MFCLFVRFPPFFLVFFNPRFSTMSSGGAVFAGGPFVGPFVGPVGPVGGVGPPGGAAARPTNCFDPVSLPTFDVDGKVGETLKSLQIGLGHCADLKRLHDELRRIVITMQTYVHIAHDSPCIQASESNHSANKLMEGVDQAHKFLQEEYATLATSVLRADRTFALSPLPERQRKMIRDISLNAAHSKVRTVITCDVVENLGKRQKSMKYGVLGNLQNTLRSYEEPFERSLAGLHASEQAAELLASIDVGRMRCDTLKDLHDEAWRSVAEVETHVSIFEERGLAPPTLEPVDAIERWHACLKQYQGTLTEAAQAVAATWTMPLNEAHWGCVTSLRRFLDDHGPHVRSLLQRIEQRHDQLQRQVEGMHMDLQIYGEALRDLECMDFTEEEAACIASTCPGPTYPGPTCPGADAAGGAI